MEKLKSDLNQLNKALKSLKASLDLVDRVNQLKDTELLLSAEDSIIQRFEYSYEGFWKYLKNI